MTLHSMRKEYFIFMNKELRQIILSKSHNSLFVMHPSSNKMYLTSANYVDSLELSQNMWQGKFVRKSKMSIKFFQEYYSHSKYLNGSGKESS